jgi:hypothetical protein
LTLPPPAHCRRNHFLPSLDRIALLSDLPSFPSDPTQRATTLIDLYLVSVLLDAGAGPDWTYTEKDKRGNVSWKGGRSEGLAVASWHMFVDGVFSGDKSKPLQVDGESVGSADVAMVWLSYPTRRYGDAGILLVEPHHVHARDEK